MAAEHQTQEKGGEQEKAVIEAHATLLSQRVAQCNQVRDLAGWIGDSPEKMKRASA
jgi:hypothetical protein